MNVLLINHFPLEGSGSGTYTLNIVHHLAKRGHKVCVIFPENMTPQSFDDVELRPVYFDETGICTDALPFNFPCFTTHPRSLTTFADLSEEELEAYKQAFRKALAEAVEEFQPDIIHAQHIWILADLALETGIPCVITIHGTDLMGYDKWPQFYDMGKRIADQCAGIISISKDNLSAAAELFPEAQDKMTLLMNGYNEDVFYTEAIDRAQLLAEHNIPYQGEQVVLFAGKLTGFKGVDTLLRATAHYEKEAEEAGKPIITLIAGSGEMWDSMHDLAAELKLKNLHFLGHQQQNDLRKLYNIADVFAMPSRREPFGLVALEAMACGLGVVATNEGGLPEFVTPDVGALVDVDDHEALAREIKAQLALRAENPKERKSFIAQKTFEKYAQSKFIVKLEALYQTYIDALS